jgi:hypothetical protein
MMGAFQKKGLWMTFGFTFGMSISLVVCNNVLESTAPVQSEVYQPSKDFQNFARICEKLCYPDPSIVVGEPFPGRVGPETYCACAGDRPRIAARWR